MKMNPNLQIDRGAFRSILHQAFEQAAGYLETLPRRPVARPSELPARHRLPSEGLGASQALRSFQEALEGNLSASPGPRYFGFVTGGSTPAGLAADWLTSAYDQNPALAVSSVAATVELEALELLRELVRLPAQFTGSLVTGATMANFVGLATARQWVGEQMSLDVAENGLSFSIPVLAATPHISAIKALAMLGLGRQAWRKVGSLPDREALDVAALRVELERLNGAPSIVVASAGTVNTGDFDDLVQVASLCREFRAWLHVDAAFGLYAACSPQTERLVLGIDLADSIAADGHKWLNIPYDCGIQFTRHVTLQQEVFRTMAPYLGESQLATPNLANGSPESSQRFRGLPIWMTLMAYGRAGYRDIVERNCAFAAALGDWVERSDQFELLAPVRLNVVCFRLADTVIGGRDEKTVTTGFLNRLAKDGRVFLTPAHYAGRHGIRAAISNWSTTEEADLAITTAALDEMARYTAK